MLPVKIRLISSDLSPVEVQEYGAGHALELYPSEDKLIVQVLISCPGCSKLFMLGDRFSGSSAVPKISSNPRQLSIDSPVSHACGAKFTVCFGTINWIESPSTGETASNE